MKNLQDWKAWAKTFPAYAEKDAPYKSPFTIVNKGSATEDAEILLYDVIGRDFWSGEGWAAKDFAEKLKEINPNSRLIVGLDSPGGNVDDGLAILNMLLRRGNVVTRNDGMAASIASVILQAGDTRQSHSAAMVMIHRAWGVMAGNATEAAKFQAILEKHDEVISDVYASKSGKKAAKFLQLMEDETWLTGSEAKDLGLVDEVLSADTKNLRGQSSAPTNHANQAPAPDALAPIISASTTETGGSQINDSANTTTTMPTETPKAAESTPAVDLTPLLAELKAMREDLKATQTANSLPGAAPITQRIQVENLGNPLVEKFNNTYDTVEKSKMAKATYNDLRKQLLIAKGGCELGAIENRFDFNNPKIMNTNTVDSALANTVLSGEFVTTMRTYTGYWPAFTRKIELSPVSRRQVIEVPLYSSVGSKQQNATNYETGDTVLAPIAVTVAEESKSFHVSRPEANLGLQMAGLIPTNAAVLAEGINTKMTALITTGNFGASTNIGALTDFAPGTDVAAILAVGKNYRKVTLVLDGGHYAYLFAQADRNSITPGDPGAFGFDGGIYKNNLWTSSTANTVGFLCGPDAIVNAWGMADGLPAGEAISQSTVDINGIPFGLSIWFSRGTRAVWGSIQVMHGTAVGDATQGEVLANQ